MKIIVLFLLFCLVRSSWQFGILFKRFSTTSSPTTTTTKPPDSCISGTRTWGLCSGSSPWRTTEDSCAPISEPCSKGKAIASKFLKAFIPSNIPSEEVTYSRSPPALTPPKRPPPPSSAGKAGPSGPNVFFPPRIQSGSYGPSLSGSLFPLPPSTSGLASNFNQFYLLLNHFNSSSRSVLNYNSFSHTLARKKRQVKITSVAPKRDLLIMMDESGSVGRTKFEKAKTIASGIVKVLCGEQVMSKDRTRVSIMSFDSVNHLHVPLLHPTWSWLNNNADSLYGYIHGNIHYNYKTAGNTCLNSALLYARNVALSAFKGGRRGQKNVLQEIILITDGCSTCGGNLTKTVHELDEINNIKIYVIGISLKRACRDKLNILGSRGNCYHFFNFKKWDYNVDEFIKSVVDYTKSSSKICHLPQLIGPVNMCLPKNQKG